MAADTFTCFANLPTEIRFLIWEEALSAQTVWVISRAPAREGRRSFTASFLGPTPYVAVGLSCREARRVMEKSFIQPADPQGEPVTSHWIDPDKTVLYLGDADEAVDVLDGLNGAQVARFRHIALDWCALARGHWEELREVCQHQLPRLCPALKTLIVSRTLIDLPERGSVHKRLNPDVAGFFARLLAYTGPVYGPGARDTTWIVSAKQLLTGFGGSSPKMHLVSHYTGVISTPDELSWRVGHWGCVLADLPPAPE